MTKRVSINLKDKIGYSMGNFSYGIISQAVATYVVAFGTNILGVKGTLIGLIVSISVVWDALTDPVMGYISDNTVSKKYGKRHLYLIFGIIGMAIGNLFIWRINENWSDGLKFVFLLIMLLLIKTFITIYTTPYTALGAELSEDYHERTSIQGIRTIFFLTGIMAATVTSLFIFFNPTEKYPIGQNNPAAYVNLGIFTTVAGVIFAVVCIVTSFKYIPQINKPRPVNLEAKTIKMLFKSFAGTFKNRYFRLVALAYLFANIASALINSVGLHVYTYTFGLNNKETSLAMGVIFVIAVFSQPLWVALSKRFDKKPTILMSVGICMIGFVLFLIMVLVRDDVSQIRIIIFGVSIVLGLGIGGLFALPYSMIADSIDFEELQTGERTEGTYYGVLTLAYKMSQSFSIMVMGIILDVIKFDGSLDVQTQATSTALGLSVAVGCLIAFALSGFCYWLYDLNRDKVIAIQEQLHQRRSEGL